MEQRQNLLDIVRRLSGEGLSLRFSSGELRRCMTFAFSAERTLRFGSDAEVFYEAKNILELNQSKFCRRKDIVLRATGE